LILRRLIAWAGFRRRADARVVLLAESAEAFKREAADHADSRETGGILVGVWADGCPWVTHACEVRSPDTGPAHYVLPAGATRSLVKQMQRADSRLGYLGDWHTHPMDGAASGVDRQTVRRLTRTAGSDAREVVLLVFRRRGRNHVIDAHLADRRGVRPASIVRTGDLA
jgi:integrative and conjugative element protein (TIGR02256 family)